MVHPFHHQIISTDFNLINNFMNKSIKQFHFPLPNYLDARSISHYQTRICFIFHFSKCFLDLFSFQNQMRERIKSIQVDIEDLTVFMLLENNITKMQLPTVHVRQPRSTNSNVCFSCSSFSLIVNFG